jgi:hypothetical protein
VLSKCANPACFTRFRYLHEGRIFNIEIRPERSNGYAHLRIEHYWLCESCARLLKVVWEDGKVTTRLKYLALPAPSRVEQQRDREVA